MSEFRQKCIGRTNLVGSFAAIPHPVAVEVMAQSGLDFLCIDWEHAQISRDTIETMVRAADVHRVPAMVRVPGHAPKRSRPHSTAARRACLCRAFRRRHRRKQR